MMAKYKHITWSLIAVFIAISASLFTVHSAYAADYPQVNGKCNGTDTSYSVPNPDIPGRTITMCKETDAIKTSDTSGGISDKTTDDKSTTCAVEKIGWILCPIMEGAAKISDKAFDVLADNFLRTDPELVRDNSGTKVGWEVARNLANIMFIIAFLWIIMAQVTGQGLTNYGIKKMLPRLIVAAIAVNVSYFICQLAVDLTNILGYEIQRAMAQIANTVGPSVFGDVSNFADTQVANTDVLSHPGILGTIIAGALASAVVVWFMLPTIAALIPLILITVATIIIILLLRKALIVLLIVVSPIAFVLYLLPNTEKYFSKWMKMFGQLLMVFPVVALLFGAGQLASTIVLVAGSNGGQAATAAAACNPDDEKARRAYNEAKTAGNGALCGEEAIVVQNGKAGNNECFPGQPCKASGRVTANWSLGLVAVGIAIAPMLAVWAVLKGALSAAGAIGGKITSAVSKGVAGGVNGSTKGVAGKYKNSSFGKYRSAQAEDRNRRISAGNYAGSPGNPLDAVRRKRAGLNKTLNNNAAFNKITGGYGGQRDLLAQAQDNKDSNEAQAMFSSDDGLMKAWALTGGNANQITPGMGLQKDQIDQFKKMAGAGQNLKPTSFLAAAQYLSENGKGSAREINAALANAAKHGTSQVAISQALEAAKASARKSGRGDMLHELGGATSGAAGWSQVAAESVHREGLTAGSTGLKAYQDYLAGAGGVSSPDAITKSLRGFDRMEARAQNAARGSIIAAAQSHTGNGAISSIEEAKQAMGITT